ncbi:MAG: SusD/RagB family nutrient-binding outer membrane lipoprotein, partial [Muribaculaceae bacterium]|nr:SusD/RagB family nutrient-binding outer membrane lipoprotein [Muribaculaceae bacterium]
MKLHKYIFGIIAGALIGGPMMSCTHDFEEINTDPNTMPVGDLNPYGVFEATFYGMTKRQGYLSWSYSNELVQFTACTGSNGKDFHRYSFNNNNVSTVWNNYAQYAANAHHMAQLGINKNEPAAQAVGLTLKVFAMSNLTDLFGDIPYEEAFQYDKNNWTPKFNSQKEVYELMFDDLEEANNLYSKSPVFAKPSIDLMYNGDMALWRKFNNSIYLRLLMRVSGRPEMGAAAK